MRSIVILPLHNIIMLLKMFVTSRLSIIIKTCGLALVAFTFLVSAPAQSDADEPELFHQMLVKFSEKTVKDFVSHAMKGERYPLLHTISGLRYQVLKTYLYISGFRDTLSCSRRRNSQTPVPEEETKFCEKYDHIIDSAKDGLINVDQLEKLYMHMKPLLAREVEAQKAHKEILAWIGQKLRCIKEPSICGRDERMLLQRLLKHRPNLISVYRQYLYQLQEELTPKTRVVSTKKRELIPCDGTGITSTGVRLAYGMVFVKPSTFLMGSKDGSVNERPVHTVELDSFWIDQCEVTNSKYLAMAVVHEELRRSKLARDYHDGGYLKNWEGDLTPPRHMDNYPVSHVSWHAAQLYCNVQNKRLPTEAEWEYASRAGSFSEYSFGNDEIGLIDYGWFEENSEKHTHPVSRKLPNRFFIYDMPGNVWEWVGDVYGPYTSERVKNPLGPKDGAYRVIRGGSYQSPAKDLRSSVRGDDVPSRTHPDVGFRCVADTKPES